MGKWRRVPPLKISGDGRKAGPWLDHARDLYGEETAARIARYFAFKVQKPNVKINHALLLGGAQGIGKDTLIEPLNMQSARGISKKSHRRQSSAGLMGM